MEFLDDHVLQCALIPAYNLSRSIIREITAVEPGVAEGCHIPSEHELHNASLFKRSGGRDQATKSDLHGATQAARSILARSISGLAVLAGKGPSFGII